MSQFVRKNGFTDPLNGYQIVTWTMILITVTITNIVYIPNLSRNRKITEHSLNRLFIRTNFTMKSPIWFSAVLLLVTIMHFVFHFLAASADPKAWFRSIHNFG